MRRFIIIFVFIVFTTCVWAQMEIEETAIQDTQTVELTPPDSLNIETVLIDTLEEKVDPKLLLVEMENFLDEKRKIENDLFLPHLIYKENFHLSSPFNLNMRITKNGFSEIPFSTCNIQTVQNNRSIFKTIYKRGNIFYNSWDYSLPVALTETYMGLGDIDMNNIAVSLMKGSIFGIPKFDMQLDFLGEKGIWQGYENETSQNFHLHLSYDLDFAKIHFDNSLIDQTLPGEKDIYAYSYPFNSASNKEKEYSIKVENRIIDIGFKYRNNDYFMKYIFRKERNLMQFLAQKKIHTQNHRLDISYEYVSEYITNNKFDTILTTTYEGNSFHILSLDHDSNLLGFDVGNTGFYQSENNYQFNSELIKKIFRGFNLLGEYNTSSIEFYQDIFSNDLQHQTRSKIGGGILINPSHIKIKVMIGQNSIGYSKGDYFEVQNTINLSIVKNLGLRFEHWLRNERTGNFIDEDDLYVRTFPKWQMSNLLELTYFLKHNNAIKLGLKNIYHSSYSYTLDDLEMIFRNDTENFDAYLIIQLTDRFEISVDAVNLTNNKTMFTNYDHPGTHFNFNVHWIFVN